MIIDKIKNNKVYFLLFPSLIIIFLVSIYPIYYAIKLGFQKWVLYLSRQPQEFVGFENYIRAFGDSLFINSVKVTIVYTFLSVFLSVFLGLLFALYLQREGKFNTLLKSMLIFPFAISPALKGFTFRFMLNSEYGILDRILNIIFPFTENIIWLSNTAWAIFFLAMSEVWGWVPLIALMFLGALGNISPSIFESAKVEGANNFQIFYHITLPLLKPTILVAVLLRIIFSLKMFDQVVTMTGGGPGRSTQVLNHYIYQLAFNNLDMGYAAAVAGILILFMIFVSAMYVKVTLD